MRPKASSDSGGDCVALHQAARTGFAGEEGGRCLSPPSHARIFHDFGRRIAESKAEVACEMAGILETALQRDLRY